MSEQNVAAIVVGLGVHGRGIATLISKAGMRIAGAVDPFHVGKRLSELTDQAAHDEVIIVSDLEDLAKLEEPADISIITAKVPVPKLVDIAIVGVQMGTDVLALPEDAFDMARFAPEEYARLDAAAKAAGQTFVATGSQDVLWAGLVIQMSSQLSDITEICLETQLGIDGYPEEFVTWCGIGNTDEQFNETSADAATTPSVFGAVLPVIATKLGLTVTEQSREMTPVYHDEVLYSESLGREIPVGQIVGRRDATTVRTAEGITLTAGLESTARMGNDVFTATFEGTPRTVLTHQLDPANLSVDATVINRIPDILSAPAGVIRTVDLPVPHYRHPARVPSKA